MSLDPVSALISRWAKTTASERAKEANGLIRYLRPEYQNPSGIKSQQQSLNVPDLPRSADFQSAVSQSCTLPPPVTTPASPVPVRHRKSDPQPRVPRPRGSTLNPPKARWPSTLPARVQPVTAILAKSTGPLTTDPIAAHFKNARRSAIQGILETLCTLGHAHKGNQKSGRS